MIPPQTMQQLTLYLRYLLSLPKDVSSDISVESISEKLQLKPDLVRRDMELLCPLVRSTEYNAKDLVHSIGQYIHCNDVTPVVLVGVGKLGKALMGYASFTVFGLDILAGFDINPDVIRKGAFGKPVYPLETLKETCRRLGAHIGIITVPGNCAQEVCDMLIEAGIIAIWNFTAPHLLVPDSVMVINEDVAKSLVRLSDYVSKKLSEKEHTGAK